MNRPLKNTNQVLNFLLTSMLVWQFAGTSGAADWPRFRGPQGDGKSADQKIPTEWSDSKNLAWKLKLPGAGFSSPIVVGKYVFVTAFSGSGSDVTRHLICVDRATGKSVWEKSVDGLSDGADSGFAYHGQASHTPVSDGERVYVMFGSSGAKAYDLSGKLLWEQEVGNERNARFGTASSPILHGDAVIITAGSESESLRAFNKITGKEIWKTEASSLSNSYSTPLIVTNSAGADELLHSVAREVWSLNPKTGKMNWYAETRVDTAACPSLLVNDEVVYVVGGRSGGRTAVKMGGKSDVTDTNVVWSQSGGSYVPSPIFHEGKLFWVNDRGIATCVDAKTGEQVGNRRLGGRFYSSVTMIGGKLYAVSRFDGTHVLEASTEFESIAHNKFDDESDFSGSPAVSDGQLFIRSDAALYCISSK